MLLHANNLQGLLASVNDVSKSKCHHHLLYYFIYFYIFVCACNVDGCMETDENIPDYMGATGIREIAFEEIASTSVVTPYGAFPMFLASGTATTLFGRTLFRSSDGVSNATLYEYVQHIVT
jgi:hypothetical protein